MDICNFPHHILENIIINVNYKDMMNLTKTNRFLQDFIAHSTTLMRRLKLVWKPRQDIETMQQSNRIYKSVIFDGFEGHLNNFDFGSKY